MKKALLDQRYQLIKSHILNPEDSPLSAKDQDLLDRLVSASKLLDKNPIRKHAVALHQKKYPGISRTQAYQDLNLAAKLYNSFHNFDYDFWLTWVINDIIKNIQRCENSATPQDRKIISAEHANLIKAIGKRPEDIPDPRRHEKHQYLIVVNLDNKKYELNINDLKQLPPATLRELNKSLISGPEISDVQAKDIINS